MKKLVNILLLSAALGFAILVAASLRLTCDAISERGLKRVLLEVWYGRDYDQGM